MKGFKMIMLKSLFVLSSLALAGGSLYEESSAVQSFVSAVDVPLGQLVKPKDSPAPAPVLGSSVQPSYDLIKGKEIGDDVTVSFKVLGTKHFPASDSKPGLLLINSSADHTDPKGITVSVKGIPSDPNLLGKTVTVKGSVGLYKGKKQIVSSVDQITVK